MLFFNPTPHRGEKYYRMWYFLLLSNFYASCLCFSVLSLFLTIWSLETWLSLLVKSDNQSSIFIVYGCCYHKQLLKQLICVHNHVKFFKIRIDLLLLNAQSVRHCKKSLIMKLYCIQDLVKMWFAEVKRNTAPWNL